MDDIRTRTVGQSAIVFVAVAGLLYLIVTRIQRVVHERKLLPLPPSPPGLPLIGSLLELQKAAKTREEHLLFQKWAQDLGPVYKVKVGLYTQYERPDSISTLDEKPCADETLLSRYMINTDYAVKQILDKAARHSSSRLPTLVGREQMCNSWSMLSLDADHPKWKLGRKVTWSNVGSIQRANEGLDYLHYETLKFLHDVVSDKNLQESGPALWGAVKRYTYSNFATQMFGLDVPNLSDESIEYIHDTGTAQAVATIPGMYLVDVLPILDYLPLFLKPWERSARGRFRQDMRWVTDKLRRVQAMSDRSLIKDSLMCKIVEDEKNLGFPSKEEGAYLCLQLTIAGSDTSQASTWCFLEAMMRYPDVQKKAQRLVDEAVGDRVPVFEDHERIPYIRCLVKETLRWRPPVSLGQAHMTTADIEFEGMRIPKGACVQLNAWAVQHDANRHQDPDRYWPERYADDHTSTMESLNSSDETKRDHFAFGAGRRVCSGYNVAERSLTVAILRILWAFNVKVAPHAEDPLDGTKWTGLFPGTPGETMPVHVVPRSERVAIIEREFKAAKAKRASFVSLRTRDLPQTLSDTDIRGRNRLTGNELGQVEDWGVSRRETLGQCILCSDHFYFVYPRFIRQCLSSVST